MDGTWPTENPDELQTVKLGRPMMALLDFEAPTAWQFPWVGKPLNWQGQP